jgi:hypothetical protein
MKRSLIRKIDGVAKERAPERRTHTFFWALNETRAAVDARIRAKIASGEASPNDRFITFTWTRTEDDAV